MTIITPTYDRSQTTRPYPNARLNVQYQPSQVGPALGKTVGDIAFNEQLKADEVAVMNANRQLKEYNNGLLYDPQNGIINKRGKDAFDVPEYAMQSYDNKVGELDSYLTNDRQREAFRKSAQQMRGEFDLTMQRHVSQEIKAYDAQETEAFLKSSQSSAIAKADDPMAVAREIATQEDAIKAYSRRNGTGPELTTARIAEARSSTHMGVIENLIGQEKDIQAEQYFNAVKGQITGTDLNKAERLVDAGSRRAKAQKMADQIMSTSPTRRDSQAAIRAIEDPKLRDEVQNRVDGFFARRDQMQREDNEDATNIIAQAIDRGATWDQVNLAWKDRLTLEQRSALRAYSMAKQKGTPIETDWPTYYDLMTKASTPALQDSFMKTPLLQFRDKLGDTEFKQITQLQAALRSAGDKADAKVQIDGYRTNQQIVDDSLRAVGLDATPKYGSPDAKQVAEFRRQVDEQIAAYIGRTKQKPNNEEVQSIVDGLLFKGQVEGTGIWGFFKTNKRNYELADTETFAIKIDQVPAYEQKRIKGALQRLNKPVTEQAVIDLYNQYLKSLKGRQ